MVRFNDGFYWLNKSTRAFEKMEFFDATNGGEDPDPESGLADIADKVADEVNEPAIRGQLASLYRVMGEEPQTDFEIAMRIIKESRPVLLIDSAKPAEWQNAFRTIDRAIDAEPVKNNATLIEVAKGLERGAGRNPRLEQRWRGIHAGKSKPAPRVITAMDGAIDNLIRHADTVLSGRPIIQQ